MTQQHKKSKWGFGIFAFYGAFILFILALVLFVSIQDIQLVDENYYANDLAYQEHIDQVAQTKALSTDVKIAYDAKSRSLIFDFPQEIDAKSISGTIILFRPSNSHLDARVAIQADEAGRQIIDAAGMATGMWRVRIYWQDETKKYFSEEVIVK